MYTATQGALVFDSHPAGGKNSPYFSDGLTYNCTYPGGGEKQNNKQGKKARKHTLDRAPNHATVSIRQMQEGGRENA